jgi:hypothetical protein
VPAAIALTGAAGMNASADTLRLNDGRTLRGELVSISRGVVVFDQDLGYSGSSYGRTRRVRINQSRVEAIDFTDEQSLGEDDDSYGTYDRFGSSRQQEILVRADRQWTDTGIEVRAGDTLRFDASGVVTWGPGRQDNPEGEFNSPYNANRPIPSRPAGALIGRIGTGMSDVFFIGGDRGTFRARTSGRLYLGINDDYLQDNSGSFRVVVEHQ